MRALDAIASAMLSNKPLMGYVWECRLVRCKCVLFDPVLAIVRSANGDNDLINVRFGALCRLEPGICKVREVRKPN